MHRAPVSQANVAEAKGGGGSQEAELAKAVAKMATDPKQSAQRFPVYERSNGWFGALWSGEEYKLTNDALEFLQPKIDTVIANSGQKGTIDLSRLRFSEGDFDRSAGGSWLGGNKIQLPKGSTSASFMGQLLQAAHESFHIAQGYVLGGGDLNVGHKLLGYYYSNGTGNEAYDHHLERMLEKQKWNEMVPGRIVPYELEANHFGTRLYQAYY